LFHKTKSRERHHNIKENDKSVKIALFFDLVNVYQCNRLKMLKNRIGRSSAVETYGLTFEQIDYAIFTGMLQFQDIGNRLLFSKAI